MWSPDQLRHTPPAVLGRQPLRLGDFIDDIGHQAFYAAEPLKLILIQPGAGQELKNIGYRLLVLRRPLDRVAILRHRGRHGGCFSDRHLDARAAPTARTYIFQ